MNYYKQPTGPGSRMMRGGHFMLEGIFDKGQMIGEGVMIVFDKFEEVT